MYIVTFTAHQQRNFVWIPTFFWLATPLECGLGIGVEIWQIKNISLSLCMLAWHWETWRDLCNLYIALSKCVNSTNAANRLSVHEMTWFNTYYKLKYLKKSEKFKSLLISIRFKIGWSFNDTAAMIPSFSKQPFEACSIRGVPDHVYLYYLHCQRRSLVFKKCPDHCGMMEPRRMVAAGSLNDGLNRCGCVYISI